MITLLYYRIMNENNYTENNTSNNEYRVQSELVAQASSLYMPKECHLDFMTGMQYHAPFIRSCSNNLTDLDGSIICTFPPHFVFKVHGFKTQAVRRGNDKELQQSIVAEEERQKWMCARVTATNYGWEAQQRKKSVRKYVMEDKGKVYDKELDEPRLVGKVPGLNVYLELVGCLDRVSMEDIDWYGEFGAIATMKRACAYALHFWPSVDRRRMASREDDPQLFPDWHEDYDPAVKPPFQPRNGLGYTNIDPARRFKDLK